MDRHISSKIQCGEDIVEVTVDTKTEILQNVDEKILNDIYERLYGKPDSTESETFSDFVVQKIIDYYGSPFVLHSSDYYQTKASQWVEKLKKEDPMGGFDWDGQYSSKLSSSAIRSSAYDDLVWNAEKVIPMLKNCIQSLKKRIRKRENNSQDFWERLFDTTPLSTLKSQKKGAEELLPLLEKEAEHVEQVKRTRKNYSNMKQRWMTAYFRASCLIVETDDLTCIYWDNDCEFDIFRKEEEIRQTVQSLKERLTAVRTEQERIQREMVEIRKKEDAADNEGEKAVSYALDWFLADYPWMMSVKNDCESKYRRHCILLQNPEYINMTQEYDHILVGSNCVVAIETKHWRGKVKIQSDGKWLRDSSGNGDYTGVESPMYQMRRHEKLLKSILPNDVSIHSLLVFSNSAVVIENDHHHLEYPLVYLEQLESVLSDIFREDDGNKERVTSIMNEIERHKTGKSFQ